MRLRAITIVTLLLLVGDGCGGSGAHARKAVADPFSYDTGQPLGFVDHGRANRDYPIAVHDVSYVSGRDRISGYLVLPPQRAKPRPAVVYLHGSAGDRSVFLVPATWIAARGAVALTITAPSVTASAGSGGTGITELRREVQLEARDVVAIRRAVDLLRSRRDVDPSRIGFVGWSAGARTGAILSAVEPRFRTIVLMSGGASPVASYAAGAPRRLRATIARYLRGVDPLRFIKRARASGLFLQDGTRDAIVPHAALEAFARAAPAGTTVRWYRGGHALTVTAYRDQLDWLARKLGLTGPPVNGAIAGP